MSSKDLEVRPILSPCDTWFLKRKAFSRKENDTLKMHQNSSEDKIEVTKSSWRVFLHLLSARHTFEAYLSTYLQTVLNGHEGSVLVPGDIHQWVRQARSPVWPLKTDSGFPLREL